MPARRTKFRYGAVAKHGSIAVAERSVLTMKTALNLVAALLMMA